MSRSYQQRNSFCSNFHIFANVPWQALQQQSSLLLNSSPSISGSNTNKVGDLGDTITTSACIANEAFPAGNVNGHPLNVHNTDTECAFDVDL